jgi:hypothetical protein
VFSPFLTQDRKDKIAEVAANRTLDFAFVLDGLYDVGNVAAVMRSADAFGVCALEWLIVTLQFRCRIFILSIRPLQSIIRTLAQVPAHKNGM